jgi:hypothetical protein
MTATSWATALDVGSTTVNWRELEINAFEHQPTVLRVLDPRRKYLPHASRRNLGLIYAIPLWTLFVVGMGAPILGYATMTGGRFVSVAPDPRVSIPWTGALFVLGFAVHALVVGLWIFSERSAGSYLDRLPSYLAIAFGTLCGIAVAARGSAEDVANWQLWLVPVLADVIISISFLILLAVARSRETQHPVPDKTVEPLRPVRRAVEKLDPATRQALEADIGGAISELTARGIITRDAAAKARSAPLGMLGLSMSGGHPKTDR